MLNEIVDIGELNVIDDVSAMPTILLTQRESANA